MTHQDLCRLYLDRYANKDLSGVTALFAENIQLRDWKIHVSGKANAIAETKKNFEAADTIAIDILALYENDHTVAAELKITVDETEVLHVVDVISFNEAGLIRSIRAYLGRGDHE